MTAPFDVPPAVPPVPAGGTPPIHPAADLFPMLDPDALQALAADIAAHGLRELLVIDGDGKLLDGRNRLAACQLAGIEPQFRTHHTSDPIAFVLSTNLHRRHLNTGQRAMLALAVEAMYAQEAKARQREAGALYGQNHPKEVVEILPQPLDRKSSERAGKATGTSGRNVRKAKKLKKDNPDLAKKVEKGELELERAARIQRDREAEQRRIEQARQDAANQPEQPRIDLRLGDFRDVLADVSDLDAIITDPPYPREFLPLLADLAAFADKALAPDGVLVVLMGQSHLPEVYRLLDGHRPYRWTGCYLTPGAAYASHPRRLQSHWKPFLVYGGGPRFADTIRSEGSDAAAKALHRWGQDYGAFHTLVERFTSPGDTVCDPFAGSGTTLLAAKALGRHAVGAELDPEAHATSTGRLA